MSDFNQTIILENESYEHLKTTENKLHSPPAEEESIISIKDSVTQALMEINEIMKTDKIFTGIPTGIPNLDHTFFGFQNSELVIIAGRPSMGKTAFAIHCAYNACKSLQEKMIEGTGVPAVGFFSLEMSVHQLTVRLLSMLAEIDCTRLKGKIEKDEYNKLGEASKELSSINLYINSMPSLTIAKLRTKAIELKRKYNVGIIFIDYLQLLRGTKNHSNKISEITEITQGLKAIAMELNMPVIALSQLSRALEQRDDKRPMLSDLRESGSIEQDADVVMFVYREEYYLKRKEPRQSDRKYPEWQSKLADVHNIMEIIVAKNRNGARGNVKLYYYDRTGKIEDFSHLQKIKNIKNK